MKVVLISCVSKKLSHSAKARELYISPLFKYNLDYAQTLNPDKIFILSAKYGLVDLEQEIEPYNETLNQKSNEEIKLWADKVLKQLKEFVNLKEDNIIFLAGENYRKFLIPEINNYEIPLKGLGIGKQLGYLKKQQSCVKLHHLFNNMERLNFPFDEYKIPLNGIYILFEKGEMGHGKSRIVRVGTHTGKNQLRSRLIQHFVNENKDRSIFRKNIGRAILNKRKDPYLEIWELDLTTKEAKKKFKDLINEEQQKKIEKEVTKYMQDNFSFIVFEVEDKEKRLELESKIISTISACGECKPSGNWLGLFSPKEKIRENGLWLVNELNKTPLNEEETGELKRLLNKKR